MSMAIGFSYQGSCFPTAAAARTNQCETAYPQSGSTGAGSYVVSCTGTTETGLTLHRFETGSSGVDQELSTSYASCYVGAIGSGPFTPAQASEAWAWGFIGVLTCYLVAWGCGRVLDAIGWN